MSRERARSVEQWTCVGHVVHLGSPDAFIAIYDSRGRPDVAAAHSVVERFNAVMDALLVDTRTGSFVRCDGNHGGPPCADPECWNDDANM